MYNIIAIIISVISLILSLYNFIYEKICKRTKIKIIIHKHHDFSKTQQFFITVQNYSQLPVSISSIKLNNSISCILEPTIVKEFTRKSGGTVIDRETTKSIHFPINLNSLESYSGYLEFRNVQNFDINNFFFSISTNRKFIEHAELIVDDDQTML